MCIQQMSSLLNKLPFKTRTRKIKLNPKFMVRGLCSVLITECEELGIAYDVIGDAKKVGMAIDATGDAYAVGRTV